MMYKKAQGISLNVIIIAAIALLVLVILSVIFIGRTGIFVKESSGSDYCANTLKGECRTDFNADGKQICAVGSKVGECDEGAYCCKEII